MGKNGIVQEKKKEGEKETVACVSAQEEDIPSVAEGASLTAQAPL